MSVLDELAWRGLIHDQSRDVDKVLAADKVVVYAGFDPTADSLHIGNLVPTFGLARLQRFGHSPIALVGGGTGMIGDPSGRSTERVLMDDDQIAANLACQRAQLARFLDFEVASNPATMVDNAEWLTKVPLLEFLRDIGKHFTVNAMLAKDSVSRRVEQEEGISFTEFSYMLMQAYDFLMLHDRRNCTLQVGGSDQWGNITAGIELIRKKRSKGAHGLTFPLIMNSDGTKFGKSQSGSIWLDPAKTSPYKFFQYWLNIDDRDVIKYLQYFTWLDQEAIGELAAAVAAKPEERAAQRRLAAEMTGMVHGTTELDRVKAAADVLFGGDLMRLSADDLLEVFDEAPSSDLDPLRLEGESLTVADLLAETGLAPSKSEARRLVKGGGIYLNNQRVEDGRRVATADCIEGRLLVLRKGRKHYHLVRTSGNASPQR